MTRTILFRTAACDLLAASLPLWSSSNMDYGTCGTCAIALWLLSAAPAMTVAALAVARRVTGFLDEPSL